MIGGAEKFSLQNLTKSGNIRIFKHHLVYCGILELSVLESYDGAVVSNLALQTNSLEQTV